MPTLSPIVMAHFLEPRHAGTIPDPDGDGMAGSTETSRFMRIQLRIRDNRIRTARFGTYGCAPAIAAGDYLCDQVEGRTLEDAYLWEPQHLIDALGGLPENRRYCASLAVEALQRAIADVWVRRHKEATA